jgi:hypothetical protein
MRLLSFAFIVLIATAPAVAQEPYPMFPQGGALAGHWTYRYLAIGGDANEPLEGLAAEQIDLELVEGVHGTVEGTLTEPNGTVRLTGSVTYAPEVATLRMTGEVEIEGTRYVDYYLAYLLPYWSSADGQLQTMAGRMTRIDPANPTGPAASIPFVAVQDF